MGKYFTVTLNIYVFYSKDWIPYENSQISCKFDQNFFEVCDSVPQLSQFSYATTTFHTQKPMEKNKFYKLAILLNMLVKSTYFRQFKVDMKLC